MPISKVDPIAQLIADNICELHAPQGTLKLTWLASEQQAPVRYAIGEGISRLLRAKGYIAKDAGEVTE